MDHIALRLYKTAFAVIFIALLSIPLKAQTNRNFQLTGGLTTMWIVNENAALENIVPHQEGEVPGAGFDGQQVGLSLRMLYGIDTKRKLRITTGLDYYFLRGVQRIQLAASTYFIKYPVDMPTLVLGTEYAFLEYPPGDARIYAGIEARGAFIIAKQFDFRWVRLGDNIVLDIGHGEKKPDAFRLGGAVRLGIDGEISDPIYVNFSAGYGIVNLIGRDHARGELFTPDNSEAPLPYPDDHEGYIHNMLVSFLLQYRF
ncbi:MAG: hypothetical protein V4642_03335 [Bacteroidota bacterium]